MRNWTFFKPNLLNDDDGIPHLMLYKTAFHRWDKKHRMRKVWKYILNVPHIGGVKLTKQEYESMFTKSTFKWKMYHAGSGCRWDDMIFFSCTTMKHDLEERKAAKILREQIDGRLQRNGQTEDIKVIEI